MFFPSVSIPPSFSLLFLLFLISISTFPIFLFSYYHSQFRVRVLLGFQLLHGLLNLILLHIIIRFRNFNASMSHIGFDCVHPRLDRISSKRKLDDYVADDDFLAVVRMKKDEYEAVNSSLGRGGVGGDGGVGGFDVDFKTRVFDGGSVSCSGSSSSSSRSLHFFVRNMSGGNTIVIHANSEDSIESVHEQIRKKTGIPIAEQRLIYRGKQLQCEQTLEECSIQNDAGLQLVGRMRSTEYPKTWQVVNDLVSQICRLCGGEPRGSSNVQGRVRQFLKQTNKDDNDLGFGHLQIFMSAGVPTALVMLYVSTIPGNKECAEESIKLFLTPNDEYLPKQIHTQCLPIVLEFCKLLNRTSHDSPLYISCRNTLGTLLELIEFAHGSKYFNNAKASVVIGELFPFVSELGRKVIMGLESTITTSVICRAEMLGDVRDFAAFLLPLRRAIEDQVGGKNHLPISFDHMRPCDVVEIRSLHVIFLELLEKIEDSLKEMENTIGKSAGENDGHQLLWSQYFSILKELSSISKLYQGAEEKVISVMRSRRVSLNALIRCLKRGDEHLWILEHKDLLDFESRRHLVMMMLPDVKDEYEELHEMLIDRSQLLAESFEYIAHAEPDSLHGGLFMEFKNEEATGPGVLREWFCMVCQAIFNPQNALFLPCPNDNRRFFPNPASNVDPLHLDYFGFCGRVIALALMHKVQVGIVFDRVFFLQLAGNLVSLEDVRDADPCLYMSCKRILEMDADFLDSDGLGLTFVREVEELGSRRSVELCPGGRNIALNSKNREEYVNLLIQDRFVKSISKQVAHFAQGFADILCNSTNQKFFFRSLELEDLDHMLHGSDKPICIKDWKAHTEYSGYKETDDQISWFWKIVEDMTVEQRRVLLFFWTSVRYLPVEGFGGLQSRLYIFKTSETRDRLPSSHTCFYRLCLPCYPSQAIMQDCLQIITQEHLSCSFGIW